MLFGIGSFLLIVALGWRLTFGRYLNHLQEDQRKLSLKTFQDYLNWLGSWAKSYLKLSRWDKSLNYFISWGQKNYKGWTVWIFYALALSYLYLSLSGIFFAWFVSRGLFGFPLLLHVACGGLFAISLMAVLFLRARIYLPLSGDEGSKKMSGEGGGFYCLALNRYLPRIYFQAASFWLFVLAGFFLILSTLGSMLPYFNFPAQILFFNLHRWSAVISILAAMLALDVIIVRPGQAG